LYIDINEELAKDLGKLIYRDIGIKGVARWRIDDWKVLGFKATGVSDYRPDSSGLVQAFADLAEASRGRWENVDAAEYVKDVRYGEGR
jgi:hypothetical protein